MRRRQGFDPILGYSAGTPRRIGEFCIAAFWSSGWEAANHGPCFFQLCAAWSTLG